MSILGRSHLDLAPPLSRFCLFSAYTISWTLVMLLLGFFIYLTGDLLKDQSDGFDTMNKLVTNSVQRMNENLQSFLQHHKVRYTNW